MLATIVNAILGVRTFIIVGAIAAVVSFGGGYYVKGKFCDAREAKARVASLERQLRAHQEASKEAADKAIKDQQTLSELESKFDEIRSKISAGDCLSDADAAGLQNIFRR